MPLNRSQGVYPFWNAADVTAADNSKLINDYVDVSQDV